MDLESRCRPKVCAFSYNEFLMDSGTFQFCYKLDSDFRPTNSSLSFSNIRSLIISDRYTDGRKETLDCQLF